MRSPVLRIAISLRQALLAGCRPLLRPVHWKVHQALDSILARQPIVDSPNQGRAKERKRQSSADPTLRLALARGERFDCLIGAPRQVIEPMMSVAKRVDEDRARFGSMLRTFPTP